MTVQALKVSVDHSQFLVEDEELADMDDWDVGATYDRIERDHIGLKPGGLVIPTSRSWGDVDVVVEVVGERPDVPFDDWDHAVECSIVVTCGQLTLSGPEDGIGPDSLRVPVEPGTYRILVLSGGLDTAVEGIVHPKAEDHYRLILWPGDPIDPLVHKRGEWV